jgi:hypothetical protein
MEQLQVTLAKYAIRFWDWLTQAILWLVARTSRLITWLQQQAEKIPLTAFQWMAIIFVIFGAIYTVATPIFEAADELEHYTVLDVVKNGGLPVQSVEQPFAWREQGSQPLLYYAFGALLTKPLDTTDYLNYLNENPHSRPADPYGLGNKNLLLRDAVTSPLQGTALAIYLLRVVNVAFTLVTLWCIHKIALIIAPKRPSVALFAVALTAFNPMLVFVVASVSNTALAMMFNTLVIYLLLQDVREGFQIRRDILLAVMAMLAFATSMSGMVLLPIIVAVAVYVAQRDKKWREFALLAGTTIAVFIVTSGWWFFRNYQLYNDLSGLSVMTQLAGARLVPFTLGDLLGEFAYFRQSYWGLFGISNIFTGAGFYILIDFLVFVAMFGVVYLVLQLYAIRDFAHARRELVGVVVLLAFVLGGMIAYLVWLIAVPNAQGRLLFPFVGAISPLLATGFVEIVWWFLFFITPPDRSFVRAGDAVPNEAIHPNTLWTTRVLGFLALVVPFATILPEYAPPAPVSVIPDIAQRVYARFGDTELIAYDTGMGRYVPGELVSVTLYWRVIKPSERDLTVSVALLPPSNDEIGKVNTYPALGKLRTSTWSANSIYQDDYLIRIASDISGNFPLRLQVTWWDDQAQTRIPIFDAQDNPLDALILDMGAVISPRVFATEYASLRDVPANTREFGGLMRLEQFNFDRKTTRLILFWDDISPMDTNYTVFAQVIDKSNQVVGQFDAQPILPTSFWRFGERYYTDHPLVYPDGYPLPEGTYSLIVGVYDLATMQRLTVPLQNDDPDSPIVVDYYRLFNFDVDAQGNISSEELDELQPEKTPEATPESTSESTSEATDETASESTNDTIGESSENPMDLSEATPALAPTP